MKKILFLFALLASITASATVTVTPLGVDYSTQKVTFSVSWTGSPANNRVWVWVDFCSINGMSPGSFTPATITSPTKTGGNGTITSATARGFFIEYGETNAGTTVTATLNNAPADKFNWCVYGSDAPPKVTAANGTYTLYGTPPFILTAASGAATQTVEATSIATSAVTITPVTLTDQTGCPGVFCIYYGSDLYIDGTHLCQQRTSGANNWETYIKDSRDNQIYRITQFTDNSWWFADDFNRNENVTQTCGGKYYYAMTNHPNCPAGWNIPSVAQLKIRWPTPHLGDEYGGVIAIGYAGYFSSSCYSDAGGRFDLIATGCEPTSPLADVAGKRIWTCNNSPHNQGRMRCWRTL